MSRPDYPAMARRSSGLQLAKIRFIEDWEAGLRPTIQQYVVRHPEFAEELAEFILEFVATENAVAGVPEPEQPTELSERALKRAAVSRGHTQRSASRPAPTTLLEAAKVSGVPLLNLVEMLNLSNQAVVRILRGEVLDPPRYLVRRLAQALNRAEEEIAALVSLPVPRQVLLGGHHRIVEGDSVSVADEGPVSPRPKQTHFEQLLGECSDMKEDQRQFWHEVLLRERSSSSGQGGAN
jgi:transcriptional regulator with XRE-family HTH domain